VTGAFSLFRARWLQLLGIALGALIGAGYAHFIGCRTGACPITSNAWISGIYGGAMGALITGGRRRA